MQLICMLILFWLSGSLDCGINRDFYEDDIENNFFIVYNESYSQNSKKSSMDAIFSKYPTYTVLIAGQRVNDSKYLVGGIDYISQLNGSTSHSTRTSAWQSSSCSIYWYYYSESLGFAENASINISGRDYYDKYSTSKNRLSWPMKDKSGRRISNIFTYRSSSASSYRKLIYVSPCADFHNPCEACVTGFYLNGSNLCSLCFSSCSACEDASYSTCSGCYSPYVLTMYNSTDYCVSNINCASNCLKCLGPNSTNCLEAAASYYMANFPGSPQPCHLSCGNCSSALSSSCSSCKAGFAFQNYGSSRYCVTILKCYSSCTKCNEYISTQCFECHIGYYKYSSNGIAPYSCLLCGISCKSCENDFTCTECITHYYHNSSFQCELCHPSCYECNGTTYSNCESCFDSNYTLFGIYCVKESSCPTNCLKCVGNEEYECYQCVDNYYIDSLPIGSCVQCHPTCKTCSSHDASHCLSCSDSHSNETKDNSVYYCVSNTICYENCSKCIGALPTDCFSCSEGLYQTEILTPCIICPDGCVKCLYSTEVKCIECISGYFLNLSTNKCDLCHPICLECSGPTKDECSLCNNSIEYIELTNLTSCDCVGQYKYSENNVTCYKPCYDGFNYTRISNNECVEICGDGLNMGMYDCDDGNLIDEDGCSSLCKYENNFQCIFNETTFKDSCYSMNYTIEFQGNNSKSLILKFNFDISLVSEFLKNISMYIEPSNKTTPYQITDVIKKILNSSSILITFNISEPLILGDTIIIKPSSFPMNSFSSTPLNYSNYSIAALPSEVCESKCNPIITPNISTTQAAVGGVSAIVGAMSSLMNGANLAAVWTVGSLMQLITLFCLVNVPVLPNKLLDFYNGMGLANLNFLPNSIEVMRAYDKEYIKSSANKLTDKSKYHASLSGNNFVMILINLLIYGIAVGFSKLKPSCFQRFFMKMRNDYIWGGFMRMAYMSILDFGLAACVHIYHWDLHNASFYRYFSTIGAIFTLACVVATCPIIYIAIRKNRGRLGNEEFKSKYGCIYNEYKEDGIAVYSIIIFLMRRIIALLGLVFLAFSGYAQSMVFFLTSLLSLGWNIMLLPYKKKLDNLLMISVDVCLVMGHAIYGQLLKENIKDEQIKVLGNAIYFVLMSSNWILMAGMLVTAAISIIKWLKERCNKKNKVAQSADVTQEKIIDEKSLDDLKNVQVQNYLSPPDLNDSKEGLYLKKRGIPTNRKPNNLRKKPEVSYIYTDRYDSTIEEAKFNIP